MAGLNVMRYMGYGGDALVSGGAGTAMHVCGNAVRRLVTQRSTADEQTWMYEGLGISALAIHPHQECFAFCERGTPVVVRVCSMEDGSLLGTLENVGQIDVGCMAFTADGQSLVTVGALPEFATHIWDWRQGKPIVSGASPIEATSVEFNPHFSDQLTLCGGGQLYVCNVVTGSAGPELEFLQVMPPTDDALFLSQAWTGKGRLFCTTSAGSLWQVDPSACAAVGDPVLICAEDTSCTVLAAPRHLICYQSDGAIAWIGDETLVEGHRIKVPLHEGATVVTACLSASTLFIGASGGSVFDLELLQEMPDGAFRDDEEEPTAVTVKDANVIVGDVQFDSHHFLRRLLFSHAGPVNALCGVPATGAVASGGKDGNLILWNPLLGMPRQVQKLGDAVTALAAHPTTSVLAVGDARGALHVLEIAPTRLRSKLNERFGKTAIASLAWNPNGTLLALTLEASTEVWLVTFEGGTLAVLGYIEVPSDKPLVSTIGWASDKNLIVGSTAGCVFSLLDIPTTLLSETLQIAVTIKALRPSGGVEALAVFPDRVACTGAADRQVRSYKLGASGWVTVSDPAGAAAVAECKDAASSYTDHSRRVGALASHAGARLLASGAQDGCVFLRAGDNSEKAAGQRVFSVWDQGCSSAGLLQLGQGEADVVVVVGGRKGPIAVLAQTGMGELVEDSTPGAVSVSASLLTHLGDATEPVINTVLEQKAMEEMEMSNALNAAKKNETRDAVRVLKVELDTLLDVNARAPELERIDRGEIVVDAALRERIIATGDTRVMQTKAAIVRENVSKDLKASRIKGLAWDSMKVHGAELVSFFAPPTVHNFPIQEPTPREVHTLQRVHMARRIEMAAEEMHSKELGGNDPHVLDSFAAPGGADADGGDGAGAGAGGEEAEAEEGGAVGGGQDTLEDPLMYPRAEVTTRERKTAQVVMLEEAIRSVKTKFNVTFDSFVSKKQQSLGRIDEKALRLKEIAAEMRVPEDHPVLSLAESEQPENVLQVQDTEVSAAKWISPEVIAEAAAEAKRLAEQAKGDDKVDRALGQMMGGSLAGETVQGKLDQELIFPVHLVLKEGDEHSDEQLKELKEWEGEKKKLDLEKETYTKALEAEGKKLKADIQEESKKFDDSLQELSSIRLKNDYKVYGLELYKMNLIQAVVQEEDDIASKAALKQAVVDLTARREVAARAAAEYKEEVDATQKEVEARRQEAANIDRAFKRELVDHSNNKEAAELLFKLFKRRAPLDDVPPGLEPEVLEQAQAFLDEAVFHEGLVAEAQAQFEAMQDELDRLVWAHSQLDQSISETEEELVTLDTRMQKAGSDLDLVLELKQGQIEVEQAAVVTDYSDAQMVDRHLIKAHNAAIITRGSDKVSVLQEMLDFRKGIHQLQWENQRLDLEEAELLQRTKDLQLLRVTKTLQSVIKGSDEGKAAAENLALEKLITYQSNLHAQRVAAKSKQVGVSRGQARATQRENAELDEDIFALESAVVERQRLCELQGGGNQGSAQSKKATAVMSMVVTHRKLLDLAKAQTREIELMRSELVRLRARTFPSFTQLSNKGVA